MAGAPASKLSVTLLNYNYAQYLPGCIESILSQTFRDFDLTIIDDCSTDGSREIIARYLEDPRVRFIAHQQNAGFIASLVEGTEAGVAPYFTVISADDIILSPRAFEQQMTLLLSNPDASFAYGAWTYIDPAGDPIKDVQPFATDHVWTGEAEFRELSAGHYVLHTGTILRRDAYYAAGGYDTTLKYTLDNSLWVLLCGQGDVAYVAEPIYGYRTHGANASHSDAAIRGTVDEMVRMVDAGFEALPECPTKHDRRVYRRARQAALASGATMSIFAGKRAAGWKALLYAARISPTEALLQRRVLSLATRTLLGGRVALALRGLRARARSEHRHATG